MKTEEIIKDLNKYYECDCLNVSVTKYQILFNIHTSKDVNPDFDVIYKVGEIKAATWLNGYVSLLIGLDLKDYEESVRQA